MQTTQFTCYLRQYQNDFIGYGISLTKSKVDALDLLQDASIKAFQNISSFEDDSKFKSWFFTIMYHCFVSQYKKKKRRREIRESIGNARMFLVADGKAANQGEENLKVKDVEKALLSVGPKAKEALKLFVEGYHYKEISEELNIPIGTVKSRISAARSKVRTNLVTLDLLQQAA